MAEQIREPPLRYRLVGVRNDLSRVQLMVQMGHSEAMRTRDSLGDTGLFEWIVVEPDDGDEEICEQTDPQRYFVEYVRGVDPATELIRSPVFAADDISSARLRARQILQEAQVDVGTLYVEGTGDPIELGRLTVG